MLAGANDSLPPFTRPGVGGLTFWESFKSPNMRITAGNFTGSRRTGGEGRDCGETVTKGEQKDCWIGLYLE